jgi:hypothetical protein
MNRFLPILGQSFLRQNSPKYLTRPFHPVPIAGRCSLGTGQPDQGHQLQFREAVNQAMDEEMGRDNRVFLLGEEVGISEGIYTVRRNLNFEHDI